MAVIPPTREVNPRYFVVPGQVLHRLGMIATGFDPDVIILRLVVEVIVYFNLLSIMNYLEINQAPAFFSGPFFELAFGIAACLYFWVPVSHQSCKKS
jgi:hypothetical protein